MALIPPEYLNTVVALGRPSESDSVQYTASGFLYGYPTGLDPEDGRQWYRTYLITNLHVVQGEKKLMIRFNRPMNQASSIFPLELYGSNGIPVYTTHPEGADVAAIPISVKVLREQNIEFGVFQGDQHTLPREKARASGISEGDGIFVLGFPLGLAGQERNYTIVRQGVIARIQDWLRDEVSQFLIDASIYPGNSGGPVLTKPEGVHINNTQSYMRCSLIGMISSYLPYQEYAVSEQTGRRRMMFEENSGLAIVEPIDKIHETVKLAVDDRNQVAQSASKPET